VLLKDAMDAATVRAMGCVTSDDEDLCAADAPIFLIDGFSRNFDNLEGCIRIMPSEEHSTSLYGTLLFDCPVDVLERHILSRGETSGRSDDNLASARKRFDTFRLQTMPVVETLEREVEACQPVHINGSGSVEEVYEETKRASD